MDENGIQRRKFLKQAVCAGLTVAVATAVPFNAFALEESTESKNGIYKEVLVGGANSDIVLHYIKLDKELAGDFPADVSYKGTTVSVNANEYVALKKGQELLFSKVTDRFKVVAPNGDLKDLEIHCGEYLIKYGPNYAKISRNNDSIEIKGKSMAVYSFKDGIFSIVDNGKKSKKAM